MWHVVRSTYCGIINLHYFKITYLVSVSAEHNFSGEMKAGWCSFTVSTYCVALKYLRGEHD